MGCKHPLKAFQIGVHPSGKPRYKITSYDCDYITKVGDSWYCHTGTPFRGTNDLCLVSSFIEIPCGNCIGCRLDYSRQWADRCLLELEDHDSSYFLTITYDDDHVPVSFSSDPDTGEVLQEVQTLRKRDFQLFMKRLRKHFSDQKLRFFACGEYGPQTFRPHYHAIIFGLHLDDLEYYKSEFNSKLGVRYNYYKSPILERIWGDINGRFGMVVVGHVTWETCAYTARYIVKKQKGEAASCYEEFNIEPPFSLMSRKPGIARNYYEQNKNVILLRSFFNVSTEEGGRKIYPPRYYHQLFDIEYPEASAEMKLEKRKLLEFKKKMKLQNTDLSYTEMLEVEERNQLAAIKSLERKL